VVPLRIDAGGDGVVIELPTDVDGDALRSDVERRVIDLLGGRHDGGGAVTGGRVAARPVRPPDRLAGAMNVCQTTSRRR